MISAATKGVFIATQLNSTQLTQLNSVQPISAKQVSRVFVYDVINGTLTWVEFSWVELCRYKHSLIMQRQVWFILFADIVGVRINYPIRHQHTYTGVFILFADIVGVRINYPIRHQHTYTGVVRFVCIYCGCKDKLPNTSSTHLHRCGSFCLQILWV